MQICVSILFEGLVTVTPVTILPLLIFCACSSALHSHNTYRVSSGQGKVREIPDLAKVREKSGNFDEGQGKNEYWEKSGKIQGICI